MCEFIIKAHDISSRKHKYKRKDIKDQEGCARRARVLRVCNLESFGMWYMMKMANDCTARSGTSRNDYDEKLMIQACNFNKC